MGSWPLLTALTILVASGCAPDRYRRAADREVYKIIEEAERKVFGKSDPFTIETGYSGRDPASVTPDEILESRTTTGRRILDLEEALNIAVAQSREYQTQKEQLYLAALSLTGARYEFSPQFFANSTAQISGSPEGADIGQVNTRVGISQLLRTGGRLSVSLANDLLRYFTGFNSSGSGSRDSAINLLSVQLTQPILRGFGRNDPAVENLTQAERNVIYAIRSYSQFQNQFAVDIATDYFSLLGLKDVVRNNYTNYLRRLETTAYLEARAADRVAPSEVDDARSAELSARIGYIDSVASYLNQVAVFKMNLGLPLTEDLYLEDRDLEELIAAGLIPVEIDRNAAFRIAVENHMDILNAIDRFEDSKRKLRLAADQLKPELGLFATANLESERPYDYANFDLDELRYSAGFNLELPVDRLRQRNAYRAALVSFESQIRSLALTLDSFKERIDRGLRTLEERRLNYLNRQMALDVARRRVQMNVILLEAGRVQVRDLREAQDSLISAQNQMTSTLISYLQARLQLLLDIGVLKTAPPRFWLLDPLAELAAQGRVSAPPRADSDIAPPDQYLEPTP